MTTIPDISPDFGSVKNLEVPVSNRPIATADTTITSKAIAQAGAEGVDEAMRLRDQQGKLDAAYAKSNYMTSMVNFSKDEENNPDWQGTKNRWEKANADAMNQAAAGIRNPMAREMFMADAKDDSVKIYSGVLQNADVKRRGAGQASTISAGQNNLTAALNAPNEETSSSIIGNTLGIYKGATDTGLWNPVEEVTQRNKFIKDYSEGRIQQFMNKGDAAGAVNWYNMHKDMLSGPDQLEMEKSLHSTTIHVTGRQNADALLSGGNRPEPIGAPPVGVQATVASAASNAGVDQNHALTVLRIESANGKNLGTDPERMSIGQDKESSGKPIEVQASALVSNLNKADQQATNALGRPAEPWEGYACYQQGSGGGPALLKAAQSDPTANAVDVLTPLYKDQKTAAKAIVGNGGNETMTAQQFLDFLKDKYTANASRAQCDIPPANQTPMPGVDEANKEADKSLSTLLLDSKQGVGIPVQAAPTPMQSLLNLDKIYPDALMKANAIPNIDERESTIQALEHTHAVYQTAANAWKTQFLNQAQQLATDPKFTDITQIPPDMKSALADSPETMTYLEARAEHNLISGGGTVTKDMREYGTGFYDMFKAIHAQEGDPSRITDITQLQSHVGKDGDLTIAGYDKLSNELNGKGTPEGEAEGMMKKQFFANAKAQISGADEGLHIKDPRGDELFLKFMANALPAYESGRKEGKTPAQLLNPESADYIGKAISSFKRPMSQWMGDMMSDGGARSLADIIKEAKATKDPDKLAKLKTEAVNLGLVKDDTVKTKSQAPQVPLGE